MWRYPSCPAMENLCVMRRALVREPLADRLVDDLLDDLRSMTSARAERAPSPAVPRSAFCLVLPPDFVESGWLRFEFSR
jgi:hypothetical protein